MVAFGSCSSRYFRYSNGLRSFSLADSIKLKVIALALAPLGLSTNKKFFRAMTKGLIERSLLLLSISSRPSKRKAFRAAHWLRQYYMARPR